jgi:hypothetical protein
MSETYILEKIKNTTRNFHFGNVQVLQKMELPSNVDIFKIFKTLENHIPQHYFIGLKGIEVNHREEFAQRNISAIYKNDWMYISNQQDSTSDLLNDLVHELAHHVETTHEDVIYGDHVLAKEFLDKRKMLSHELKSEGYWTSGYDFDNIEYSEELDTFLYKRVGPRVLPMITTGLYVRPYSAVSLREYFATGFEEFYLGDKNLLYKVSPELYNRIEALDKL